MPWQSPPLRFEVLQDYSPMVLASVETFDETPQPLVSHPQTSLVPRSKNHIQSIISNTVTDSDIRDYGLRSKHDVPPRHQPPLKGGEPSPVHSTDPLPIKPEATLVVLDEFVSMQVTPTHTHQGIPAYTPGMVPSVSNPVFEFVEQFVCCAHPAKPWIQLVYSVQVYVLNSYPLSITPRFA